MSDGTYPLLNKGQQDNITRTRFEIAQQKARIEKLKSQDTQHLWDNRVRTRQNNIQLRPGQAGVDFINNERRSLVNLQGKLRNYKQQYGMPVASQRATYSPAVFNQSGFPISGRNTGMGGKGVGPLSGGMLGGGFRSNNSVVPDRSANPSRSFSTMPMTKSSFSTMPLNKTASRFGKL